MLACSRNEISEYCDGVWYSVTTQSKNKVHKSKSKKDSDNRKTDTQRETVDNILRGQNEET